jgi:hypothetical protein
LCTWLCIGAACAGTLAGGLLVLGMGGAAMTGKHTALEAISASLRDVTSLRETH